MAIVSECTGHTCHSQHHVLWHFFRQPTTTVLLLFTYEFDIQEKTCFSWSWGEVQSSGSICQRAPAISEYGHQPNSPCKALIATVGGGTTPLCYNCMHTFVAAGSDSAVCLPSTRLDARWCRRILLQQDCAQVL